MWFSQPLIKIKVWFLRASLLVDVFILVFIYKLCFSTLCLIHASLHPSATLLWLLVCWKRTVAFPAGIDDSCNENVLHHIIVLSSRALDSVKNSSKSNVIIALLSLHFSIYFETHLFSILCSVSKLPLICRAMNSWLMLFFFIIFPFLLLFL